MSIDRNIEDGSSERESFAPSLIDRARDALNNATPGPWESSGTCVYAGDNDLLEDVGSPRYASKPNLKLAALAPELAAEVVRLHDEFAALADEWGKTTYFSGAAARIREVIKEQPWVASRPHAK